MSATTNSNTSETDREEIAIASYGVLSQNDEKTTPFCSCLGCRNEADVVIDHPEHGRRVVCGECARSFEVMDHV